MLSVRNITGSEDHLIHTCLKRDSRRAVGSIYMEMGADRPGLEGRAPLQADSHCQGNQESKTFSYSCWLDIANAYGIYI